MNGSLFELRPRVGDLWEFKLPKKQKKRKVVGSIAREQHEGNNGQVVILPRVNWQREPKGRYSSLRVKWLLKCGWLVTRKVEEPCQFCSGTGTVKGHEIEGREVHIEVDLDYNCPRCAGEGKIVVNKLMGKSFK